MRTGQYTLVTGGAGFVGSNLADALLARGERVVLADNLSRDGVRINAEWLQSRHPDLVRLETVDIRDAAAIGELVDGARAVYHLAAQVAVTTSLEDPTDDLQTNLIGTFNILEAIRARPDPPPLLPQVYDRPGARLLDHRHGRVELLTAVTAERMEDVPGETL